MTRAGYEVFDLQNRLLLPYQSCYGKRAGGLLWPLLSVLLVAALVGSASGQSHPPDVTGTCQDSGGGIWQLRASGPGLNSLHASWQGARVSEMVVNHRSRRAGRSKYGLSRTFKVVLDLMVVKFLASFATKPIYVFGGFGLFSFACAVAAMACWVSRWLAT